MRTMYVTRTKVLTSVTAKFIDNDDNMIVETIELPIRNCKEARAEKELNKLFAGQRKVVRILSLEPALKRYRMEESVFLDLAEEIKPLERDKKRFLEPEPESETTDVE